MEVVVKLYMIYMYIGVHNKRNLGGSGCKSPEFVFKGGAFTVTVPL